MIDMMFNSPDDTSYLPQIQALRDQGYDLKYAFFKVKDNDIEFPGGWARMIVHVISSQKLMQPPVVEYRYSQSLGGWTADGETTSSLAKGLYDNLYNQGIPE